MRSFLFLVTFSLALGSELKAFESVSPNGQWKIVSVGLSLHLIERTGVPALILDTNISALEQLDAKWSSDSQRVVILEGGPRDSTILAVWRSGLFWQKAFQAENHPALEELGDLPGLEELKGSGLLDSRLPPGFAVPMPSDDPALRDDEDPLEPGDLDLGLAPPPERIEE